MSHSMNIDYVLNNDSPPSHDQPPLENNNIFDAFRSNGNNDKQRKRQAPSDELLPETQLEEEELSSDPLQSIDRNSPTLSHLSIENNGNARKRPSPPPTPTRPDFDIQTQPSRSNQTPFFNVTSSPSFIPRENSNSPPAPNSPPQFSLCRGNSRNSPPNQSQMNTHFPNEEMNGTMRSPYNISNNNSSHSNSIPYASPAQNYSPTSPSYHNLNNNNHHNPNHNNYHNPNNNNHFPSSPNSYNHFQSSPNAYNHFPSSPNAHNQIHIPHGHSLGNSPMSLSPISNPRNPNPFPQPVQGNVNSRIHKNLSPNFTSQTKSPRIFQCEHVGCSSKYSHSSGRSNHYNTSHQEPCHIILECKQCQSVDKKQKTKKVPCRHEVGCTKHMSTSNRANHEKNQGMHTKCSENCQKCQEYGIGKYSLKGQSFLEQSNENASSSSSSDETESDEIGPSTTTTTTTNTHQNQSQNQNKPKKKK